MSLTFQVIAELVRFELLQALGGFRRIHASVRNAPRLPVVGAPHLVSEVCEAINRVACFYWKPVLCLQRAAVTTRLLRRHGVDACMVIGYRPSPFLSHAWVEVGGTIVNDSPAYQERLIVLDRL